MKNTHRDTANDITHGAALDEEEGRITPRHYFIISPVLLCLLWMPVRSWADGAPSLLTLDHALALTLEHNPRIAAAHADIAAEPHAQQQEIALSPELRTVLRAEMQEIAAGIQRIALALGSADWQTIQDTSAKIHKSYMMEKQLTAEQTEELERVLPERFQQFDAEFHQRAARLGAAASAHDAELVAFHYARLVESCVQCHSAYARARFPGFVVPVEKEHHHH